MPKRTKVKQVDSYAAEGGKARAAALTPEQRSEIARKAVAARWDKDDKMPKATHEGPLTIGDMVFPASVLSNGERVLTQSDFMDGMGMYYSGWIAKKRDRSNEPADLPHFLGFKALEPYVAKHLGDLQSITVKYRTLKGGIAHGLKAQIIPKLCEIWLDADDETTLPARQKQIAAKAKILMRALAHTGIIALVDEATGYQYERPQQDLQEFLKKFISEELRRWVKTFPNDYFKQMCRLRGVALRPDMRLPSYFGHLTNDVVYNRLAPGVREELQRKNPANEKGNRPAKHHSWLTEDIGHPKLLQHLGLVVGLMKISPDWDTFKKHLDVAAPDYSGMPLLQLIQSAEADE